MAKETTKLSMYGKLFSNVTRLIVDILEPTII